VNTTADKTKTVAVETAKEVKAEVVSDAKQTSSAVKQTKGAVKTDVKAESKTKVTTGAKAGNK